MAKRYTCLICRNEIAHPGAECPYCRGRFVIAEGASPRVLAVVFAVMICVFALTGLYARAFKNEREQRGGLYFETAQRELSEERYGEAISSYRDALLYSRDDRTYRLGLSKALFADGKYSETENYLVELRVEDPTSGIVNHLLARLAARDGRTDAAISYYRTAIYGAWDEAEEDEAATRLRLRLELVDLLERAGREEQLTAEVVELAGMAPDDTAIRTRLARLLLHVGAYDRASSLFESLIAADPDNREALLGRADAEFELGNYLTARTHYNRAQLRGTDESTIARIALCNRIIELDPTRRGIRLSERFRRSGILVEMALSALSTCRNPAGNDLVGPLPPLPAEQAEATARAEGALRARRPGATDADVEANILLTEEIWDIARPLCETEDLPDEALLHVLAKLSR